MRHCVLLYLKWKLLKITTVFQKIELQDLRIFQVFFCTKMKLNDVNLFWLTFFLRRLAFYTVTGCNDQSSQRRRLFNYDADRARSTSDLIPIEPEHRSSLDAFGLPNWIKSEFSSQWCFGITDSSLRFRPTPMIFRLWPGLEVEVGVRSDIWTLVIPE